MKDTLTAIWTWLAVAPDSAANRLALAAWLNGVYVAMVAAGLPVYRPLCVALAAVTAALTFHWGSQRLAAAKAAKLAASNCLQFQLDREHKLDLQETDNPDTLNN